jgi:hypothetical protein
MSTFQRSIDTRRDIIETWGGAADVVESLF